MSMFVKASHVVWHSSPVPSEAWSRSSSSAFLDQSKANGISPSLVSQGSGGSQFSRHAIVDVEASGSFPSSSVPFNGTTSLVSHAVIFAASE